MRSMALEAGSAWGSRMTPAVRLTWTASGRAGLMMVWVAGEDHCSSMRSGVASKRML